jgi:hypothetical protein
MKRLAASLATLLISLSLAGCMTPGDGASDSAIQQALEEEEGATPVAPQGIIAGLAQPDTPFCPQIEIVQGSAALRGGGGGQQATGVSYQASITDVARECKFDGANMTMRIGVRGRVLIGQSGRAGTYSVPVRVAIRSGEKVLYSNLTRLSVSAGDDIGGSAFQHVEENVVVPQAPDGVELYEVFVGLDPSGAAARPTKKRRG